MSERKDMAPGTSGEAQVRDSSGTQSVLDALASVYGPVTIGEGSRK